MGCVSSDTVLQDLRYTDEVEPARPGHSATYRSPKAINGLRSCPRPDHDTLHKAFLHSFQENPASPCIGTRRPPAPGSEEHGPYEWKTYKEIQELATAFGSGIQDLCPKQTVNGDTF